MCKSNPNITYLDLRDNKINADGIEGIIRLLKNPNLSQLYLSQNNLGDESIKKIAQSLKTNDSINYLGLNSVKMRTEGLEVFLEALQRNTAIKGVDFIGRRNNDHIFKGPHIKQELESLLAENSKYPDKALARKVAYQIFDIFIDKKDISIEEKIHFLKCYEKANKEELENKLITLFNKSLTEISEQISQFIEENTGIEEFISQESSTLTQSMVDEMEPKDLEKLLFDFISQDNPQKVIELMQLKPQLVPKLVADDIKNPNLIDPGSNNLMMKLMQIKPQILDIMEPEGYQTMEFVLESKDIDTKTLEDIFKNFIWKSNNANSEKETKIFQHFIEKFLKIMIEKIKDEPKNTDLLLITGNMLHAAGKFSDAIDLYLGATKIDPLILISKDIENKAFVGCSFIDLIEKSKSSSSEQEVTIIQCFLERCLEVMEEKIEDEPHNAGLHLLLGGMLCKVEKFPEALKHYLEVKKIEPSFLIPKDIKNRDLEYSFMDLIEKSKSSSSEQEVTIIQYFLERFLEVTEEKIEDEPQNADLHLLLGNMLCKVEKFPEAITHYLEAKKINSLISTPIDELNEALAKNSDNGVVELNNQNIDSINATLISSFIKKHISITDFTLSHTQIKNNELKIICSALENNTTINNITFFDIKLDDEGAKIIAKLLKTHASLQCLHLTNNQIGNEGANYIIEALKDNNKIIELYIEDNKIDKELVEEINRHINKNANSLKEVIEKIESDYPVNELTDKKLDNQSDEEVHHIGDSSTINESIY